MAAPGSSLDDTDMMKYLDTTDSEKNSVVLVCKRTIPTERPPLSAK
jgi:hypothetical protein